MFFRGDRLLSIADFPRIFADKGAPLSLREGLQHLRSGWKTYPYKDGVVMNYVTRFVIRFTNVGLSEITNLPINPKNDLMAYLSCPFEALSFQVVNPENDPNLSNLCRSSIAEIMICIPKALVTD